MARALLNPAKEALAASDAAIRLRSGTGSQVVTRPGGTHYDALANGTEFARRQLVPLFTERSR